jgi:primosomal protein N' (replication factor Y) (superfamily II helicase)
MRRSTPAGADRDPRMAARSGLLEVALALPPFATYTYRDPRLGERVSVGAQVVVPLGSRRVTGFVVGHPDVGPVQVREIEAVLEEEPALDPEVLELCRWAAGYYLAPLGEVLRAALPQGERAAASRRIRVTDQGRLFLRRDLEGKGGFVGLGLDQIDRELLSRLARGSGLGVRGLAGTPGAARLPHLVELGFVEVGDQVEGRSRPRTEMWALLEPAAPAVFTRQQRGRQAVYQRLQESPGGLPVSGLDPRERQALRALVKSGLARIEARAPAAASELPPSPQLPRLNPHQAEALAALTAALGAGDGFHAFVLQGVTGSGKTEVYLRLIAEARRQGRGALVLVPEISLTPQLAARFRARFGDDVSVLHSALPGSQRRQAWRRLRAGEVGIALGARSAVFAPVKALGVVVVDEEHDSSFKQEEGLRYHGRDLALVRAQKAGAVAVVGSATPSLESYQNVESGRYRRLLLPTRANPAAAGRPLPPVEILDLRRDPPLADGLFSRRLLDAVRDTVGAGEQAILFLNRRGFSPLVLCRACGHVLRCSQCAVSMTFHRARGQLACHYCGLTSEPPAVCPSCSRPRLERLGAGTERVESLVREHFPGARVARLDRDSAGGSGGAGLEAVLGKVQRREIDILVGTQMVTKGHDFEGVTLVGALLPDQGMHMPDFRAAERTFQLLEQVSGRAGRGERPGRVIVQTFTPDHPAMLALAGHDYEGFVRGELARRKEAGYPPFSRLMALRLEGQAGAEVRRAAGIVAQQAVAAANRAVRVKGPAEAPIPFLRGQTRWQVWLAGSDRLALAATARQAAAASIPAGVRLVVDVDPQSVL